MKKTVLITGSSSGIGAAIAVASAKAGYFVLVTYRNNKKGGEATLKEVKKYADGKLLYADLENRSEVTKLFDDFKKASISVDYLVNNAGNSMGGALDDYDMWEKQWKNIFMSQVIVTNEFVKMPHKGQRKIVNISSIYAYPELGFEGFSQYNAAKAAVVSFTMSLAKKFTPEILVNSVAPGYTWTDPWEGTSKENLDAVKRLNRIGRFVKPEEIASAVLFLLSNDAITGEVIRVDGGLHLIHNI